MTTFFAAMLFAVIPIRNVFPANPTPGVWVDQALVLWVLIALVVAIVLYMIAWYRQSEQALSPPDTKRGFPVLEDRAHDRGIRPAVNRPMR